MTCKHGNNRSHSELHQWRVLTCAQLSWPAACEVPFLRWTCELFASYAPYLLPASCKRKLRPNICKPLEASRANLNTSQRKDYRYGDGHLC